MLKRRFGFSNSILCGEEKIYLKSVKLATIQKLGLNKIIELYKNNLDTTSQILGYCKRNQIKFYRFGTIFPFSTHEILLNFDYLNYFEDDIYELGQFIKFSDTRISIHSSPFCILSSNKKEVLAKSITEIEYHAKLMNVLELKPNSRAVVHVGSEEGGKEAAKKRFITNFNSLKEEVKSRIVLENDDK